MRHPQIVILESVGWIARQLCDLAQEGRWLLKTPRSPATALELLSERRPGVLVVEAGPADEDAAALELIASAHLRCPEAPTVAVFNKKVREADRAGWTALLMDLGARYVLYPPVTKAVLEDLIGGQVQASIRRLAAPPGDAPKGPGAPAGQERLIDLADQEFEPD